MGYDNFKTCFIINNKVSIVDRPEFRHRGVLLDSARNFMPLDVIENVINGMSFNKVIFYVRKAFSSLEFKLNLALHFIANIKFQGY